MGAPPLRQHGGVACRDSAVKGVGLDQWMGPGIEHREVHGAEHARSLRGRRESEKQVESELLGTDPHVW